MAKSGKLLGEIKRSTGMLNNENFVNRAKPEKVQEEREKLAQYQSQLNDVEKLINDLK